MDMSGLPPAQKGPLATAKLEAGTRVVALRQILGLDDDG